jgi:hypothetical protein
MNLIDKIQNGSEGNSAVAFKLKDIQELIDTAKAELSRYEIEVKELRDDISRIQKVRETRIKDANNQHKMFVRIYSLATFLISGAIGYVVRESTEMVNHVIKFIIGPALTGLGQILTQLISQVNYLSQWVWNWGSSDGLTVVPINAINDCIEQIVLGISAIAGSVGWGAGICAFLLAFLFFYLINELFFNKKKYKVGQIGMIPTVMLAMGIVQEEDKGESLIAEEDKIILQSQQRLNRLENDETQASLRQVRIQEQRNIYQARIESRGFFEQRLVDMGKVFGIQDPALAAYERAVGQGSHPAVEELQQGIEGGKKTRKKNRKLKKKKKSKKNKKTKRKISKKNKKSKKNKRSKKR